MVLQLFMRTKSAILIYSVVLRISFINSDKDPHQSKVYIFQFVILQNAVFWTCSLPVSLELTHRIPLLVLCK